MKRSTEAKDLISDDKNTDNDSEVSKELVSVFFVHINFWKKKNNLYHNVGFKKCR